MRIVTSEGASVRPPVPAASNSEVPVRPTARVRPLMPVRLQAVGTGFSPDDPYVRRFWVAALGPGPVAELLRLIRAGAEQSDVPIPVWLPTLLRADLVRVEHGELLVLALVPAVPPSFTRRFPPGLREEHRRLLLRLR